MRDTHKTGLTQRRLGRRRRVLALQNLKLPRYEILKIYDLKFYRRAAAGGERTLVLRRYDLGNKAFYAVRILLLHVPSLVNRDRPCRRST